MVGRESIESLSLPNPLFSAQESVVPKNISTGERFFIFVILSSRGGAGLLSLPDCSRPPFIFGTCKLVDARL